ncbi:hypothetical protein GCM10023340_21220 [Nocardioides marinquilinus]|uniref:MIP family channel protein n=1 Tax=Nocardioides marinquilinus TaxID=1210400 RepID=A0ABP9PK52_9ACTN
MTATPDAAPPAAEHPQHTQLQKLMAEALGTFVLVVLGVGAAALPALGLGASGSELAALSTTSIGLAFGIAIVAMVYAFGRVSGGHFNPAVSVGAAIGGRISWREAGLYSAAQVGGAIVGGIVLLLVALSADVGYEFGDDNLGANGFGDRGGAALIAVLLVEIVLTFVFLTVIFATTDERNDHPGLAPLAIGLTLAAIHFVAIPLDGTSVNPARSLSTVFFSGGDAIVQIWVFILAPLVGAALAGLAYPAIFGHATGPVPGSGFTFGSGGAPVGYTDQYQQQWSQGGQAGAYGGYDQPAQGGYQQGYQQPGQPGGYQAPGQAAQQPPAEQPIIQDGWQWDPQSQQWIPAQQQPGQGGDSTQVRPQDY